MRDRLLGSSNSLAPLLQMTSLALANFFVTNDELAAGKLVDLAPLQLNCIALAQSVWQTCLVSSGHHFILGHAASLVQRFGASRGGLV